MDEFHVGEVMEEFGEYEKVVGVFKGDMWFLMLFKVHLYDGFCAGDKVKVMNKEGF
jgi:hypothetical protein